MTYRLTLNVLFGVLLCLTGSAMAADATSRSTTVSGGTTSSGFVGDEEVTINRVSAGRFLYPKSAQRRSIEGEVVIEFNVGIDGTEQCHQRLLLKLTPQDGLTVLR